MIRYFIALSQEELDDEPLFFESLEETKEALEDGDYDKDSKIFKITVEEVK